MATAVLFSSVLPAMFGTFVKYSFTVELVGHASFGWEGWTDVGHLGAIVLFGIVMWRLAIKALERKPIT